jgi:predicted ATP-dependent endonuclease of OLD family
MAEGSEAVNQDHFVAEVLKHLDNEISKLGLGGDPGSGFEADAVSERELLQTLRLAMKGATAKKLPIARQGRGTQRLVLLALLLRLARDKPGTVIGAFEEPEEALEPVRQHQAARMLATIEQAGGQIFVATHSPDVVRAFSINDIVIVERTTTATRANSLSSLTAPARHGYERHLDGPMARALFVPMPVLVEGPSDRSVLSAFWDVLAAEGEVGDADQIGLEVVPCEGNQMMPMFARVLNEAGKRVVAWVEGDDETASRRLLDEGNVSYVIAYPAGDANNLERAMVKEIPIQSLVLGLQAVTSDRGDDWASQLAELKNKANELITEQGRLALAAATDLPAAIAVLYEPTARTVITRCLTS